MAQIALVNPRKRRKTSKKTPTRKKRRASLSTVRTTSVRRYRRNPIKSGNVVETFKQGAVGAAGALAVDVALQKLPIIPENFKTGTFAPVTRGLVGIGIGMLVSTVGKNKKLGKQLADGAVTVSLYSAGKNLLGPQLGLADGDLMGDDSLMYYGDDESMSYYGDDDDDMGWTNAAPSYDDDDDDNEFDF